MLSTLIEYLAAASLLISLVQVYLIVSKVWGRKHDRVVAESQSTASNLLGLLTGLPWVIKYTLDREIKMALVSALWLGLTLFFTLVGLGVWVPGAQRQGLWTRLRNALRLEREEVGELFKSAFRPSDATLILEILQQLSLLDHQLDPRERQFIEQFARSCGLPSPFASTGATPREGHAALHASVEEYLARRPPHEQALQLREIIVALLKTDDHLSEQESLAQRELTAMLDAYLSRDGAPGVHRVVVVPQSPEQDEAIQGLLRGATRVPFRGGSAYVAGQFYSTEYAQVMLEKYRSLGFFSILDSAPAGLHDQRPACRAWCSLAWAPWLRGRSLFDLAVRSVDLFFFSRTVLLSDCRAMSEAEDFLAHHPRSRDLGPLRADEREAMLARKTPAMVIDFLDELGHGFFGDDFFATTLPYLHDARFTEAKLKPAQCFPFLRTAFGGLIFWKRDRIWCLSPWSNKVTDGDDLALFFRFLVGDETVLNSCLGRDVWEKYAKGRATLGTDEIFVIEPKPEGAYRVKMGLSGNEPEGSYEARVVKLGAGTGGGTPARKVPAASAEDASLALVDPNLKLAVVEALLRAGQLSLDRTASQPEPADEAVRQHYLGVPVSAEQLASIRALVWGGGMEVQHAIWPDWDGEDESFDLVDLRGIEALTGLEELTLLSAASIADLGPLEALRSLRKVRLPSGAEGAVVERLRARGVEVH